MRCLGGDLAEFLVLVTRLGLLICFRCCLLRFAVSRFAGAGDGLRPQPPPPPESVWSKVTFSPEFKGGSHNRNVVDTRRKGVLAYF